MNKEFRPEIEMKTDGKIYETYGLFGGVPYSQIEILNQPITQKENLKRFYKGNDYFWIPDTFADVIDLTPEINPDSVANGYDGGVDSFGVTWEALETGMPAIVRPGNPIVKDINNWKTLKFPDVSTWDWEGCAKKYEVFDRARTFRGCTPTGLFERLIDVLDFDGAAEALIMEPEAVCDFLDAVTDYNISLIEHFIKYFQVDAIFMSDDWSAQRSPFFSSSVTRNILLPRLKRMVDFVHQKGLTYTIHSCGNGTAHIPVWIEAGVDGWQFQESAVNIDEALKLAGDKLKLEGYWIVPEGYSEDQTDEFIFSIMDKYCRNGQLAASFCDSMYLVTPYIRRKVYEIGRKIVSEMA